MAPDALVRFTVAGREGDRDLVRSVARRLAEGGPEAERLRTAVEEKASREPPVKGGILEALLASPLIGSELDLARARENGRTVNV